MPNQTPLPGHCNHPLSAENPRSSSGGLCSHLVTYGVKCAAGHDATYHIAPAAAGSVTAAAALIDEVPALDVPTSTGVDPVEEYLAQGVLQPGDDGWWTVWGASTADVRAGDIIVTLGDDRELDYTYVAEIRDDPLRIVVTDQHGKVWSYGKLSRVSLVRREKRNTLAESCR